MAALNKTYVSLLADSLRKKLEVLAGIDKLNKEQHELLKSEEFDLDAFDLNVQAKAELIEQLERLDDGFASLFERVKAEIGDNRGAYATEIKEMQHLIKSVTELSVTIEADEKRNKGLADGKFTALKKSVREARMSSSTASRYYQSMSQYDSTPQFVDKKY
jgi:hypothetical protein